MKCSPHVTGVPFEMKAFFQPGCPTCEAKKAAGKVTGNEPRPMSTRLPRIRATIAHGFGMQSDRRKPFNKGNY